MSSGEVCIKCGKILTLDNQTPYNRTHNYKICKECQNKRDRELYRNRINTRKNIPLEDLIKDNWKCRACGVKLTVKNMNKNDAIQSHRLCRNCSVIKVRKLKGKNPEYWKKKDRYRHILRKYGLSEEEFDDRVNRQNEHCAICGRELTGFGLGDTTYHLDHEHSTGKARGVLCNTCNVLTGGIENVKTILSTENFGIVGDIEVINRVVSYLRYWDERNNGNDSIQREV